MARSQVVGRQVLASALERGKRTVVGCHPIRDSPALVAGVPRRK